jgi:hypothetical protein
MTTVSELYVIRRQEVGGLAGERIGDYTRAAEWASQLEGGKT